MVNLNLNMNFEKLNEKCMNFIRIFNFRINYTMLQNKKKN